MNGFVYRWINLSNNMYYIGSHKGLPDDGYIGSGIYFKRAYKKCPNNFVRDILYQGDNFRELEQFILETLNAKKDRLSYNLKNTSIGGDTRSGQKNSKEHRIKLSKANRGKKISESQKEKLRLANLGKKHSKESKLKMSKSRTGIKNHFYGKSHTDESKRKMRQSKLGHYIGDEAMQKIWDKNKSPVYCKYLDKNFNSIIDCAKSLNLSSSSVSNMIAGRVKNRFGIQKIELK